MIHRVSIFKKTIAVALGAALLILSPGLESYRAWAAMSAEHGESIEPEFPAGAASGEVQKLDQEIPPAGIDAGLPGAELGSFPKASDSMGEAKDSAASEALPADSASAPASASAAPRPFGRFGAALRGFLDHSVRLARKLVAASQNPEQGAAASKRTWDGAGPESQDDSHLSVQTGFQRSMIEKAGRLQKPLQLARKVGGVLLIASPVLAQDAAAASPSETGRAWLFSKAGLIAAGALIGALLAAIDLSREQGRGGSAVSDSPARLIADLEKADPSDDGLFKSLVDRSAKLLGLQDKDIAHQFDVSLPTVARWRSGASAPHPLIRPQVYAWLLNYALGHSQIFLRNLNLKPTPSKGETEVQKLYLNQSRHEDVEMSLIVASAAGEEARKLKTSVAVTEWAHALDLARELGTKHQDAEFLAWVQKETAQMESLRQTVGGNKDGGSSGKMLAMLVVAGLGATALLGLPGLAFAAPMGILAASRLQTVMHAVGIGSGATLGLIGMILPDQVINFVGRLTGTKGSVAATLTSVIALAATIALAVGDAPAWASLPFMTIFLFMRGIGNRMSHFEAAAAADKKLDEAVASRKDELLAIPGVVAVLPVIVRWGDDSRRSIRVDVTELTSENKARIGSDIGGFPVEINFVPKNARESASSNAKPAKTVRLSSEDPLTLAGDYEAEEGPERGTLHLELVKTEKGVQLKGVMEASFANGGGRNHEKTDLWLAQNQSNPWRWEGKITHETGWWEGPSDISEDDVDAMGASERDTPIAVTFAQDGRFQIQTDAQFLPFSGRRAPSKGLDRQGLANPKLLGAIGASLGAAVALKVLFGLSAPAAFLTIAAALVFGALIWGMTSGWLPFIAYSLIRAYSRRAEPRIMQPGGPYSTQKDFISDEGREKGTLHVRLVETPEGTRMQATLKTSRSTDGRAVDTLAEFQLKRSKSEFASWEGLITREAGRRPEPAVLNFNKDQRVTLTAGDGQILFSGSLAKDPSSLVAAGNKKPQSDSLSRDQGAVVHRIAKAAFRIIGQIGDGLGLAVFGVPLKATEVISRLTGAPSEVAATIAMVLGGLICVGLHLVHAPALILWTGALWTVASLGLADRLLKDSINAQADQKLEAAVDARRKELLAIPGVVSVKAVSVPEDDSVERYVQVEVTHLDAENQVRIGKTVGGYSVDIRVVSKPAGGNTNDGSSGKMLAMLVVAGLGATALLGLPSLAFAAPMGVLAASHAAAALSAGRLALWLLGGAGAAIAAGILAQRLEDKGIWNTGGRGVLAAAGGIPVAAMTIAGFLAGGLPAAAVIGIGAGLGLINGDWLASNPHAGDGVQYALLLLGIYSGALVAGSLSGLLTLGAGSVALLAVMGLITGAAALDAFNTARLNEKLGQELDRVVQARRSELMAIKGVTEVKALNRMTLLDDSYQHVILVTIHDRAAKKLVLEKTEDGFLDGFRVIFYVHRYASVSWATETLETSRMHDQFTQKAIIEEFSKRAVTDDSNLGQKIEGTDFYATNVIESQYKVVWQLDNDRITVRAVVPSRLGVAVKDQIQSLLGNNHGSTAIQEVFWILAIVGAYSLGHFALKALGLSDAEIKSSRDLASLAIALAISGWAIWDIYTENKARRKGLNFLEKGLAPHRAELLAIPGVQAAKGSFLRGTPFIEIEIKIDLLDKAATERLDKVVTAIRSGGYKVGFVVETNGRWLPTAPN